MPKTMSLRFSSKRRGTKSLGKTLGVEVFFHNTVDGTFSFIVSDLQLRVHTKKLIFLFLNQTYVVGTQKNHLNEAVILSTRNIC